MDNKLECDIVKELSIQYIEKTINEGSEKFVKNHLENCKECSEFYKVMESKIYNDDGQDKLMKKHLKKVHTHINLLRISLITILIFILGATFIFWSKEQRISNLINKISEKIEYMETLDNYRITQTTMYKNLKTGEKSEFKDEYYYKNGKSKRISDSSIIFCEDNSYDSIEVYKDIKQIDYSHYNYIKQKKGGLIGVLSYVKENYQPIASTIYSLALSVREDRYNGLECYVLRFGNENSYKDIWIDKNSYITIREIDEVYGSIYTETVFTFEENIVTDEDVNTKILDSKEYDDYKRNDVNSNLSAQDLKKYNSFNLQ